MILSKKLVLFGTNRHAICINDYHMFFSRTQHQIAHIFYPLGSHKNRDWWELGAREDKARDSVVDPMTGCAAPITVWEELERDVFPVLDALDFDFICIANGSDPAHQALIKRYGRAKFLFSEYGWLPWSQHFYISRQGAGFESEVAKINRKALDPITVDEAGIETFISTLDEGVDVPYDNFIYMPMQKDVNDFKFLYNDFENNEEFLACADRVVPKDVKILVKCHPLYKKKYDLSFSDRMIDITDAGLNKYQLYQNMKALICLNSTSILEALAFGAKVFSYGDDLFTGKRVTYHKVMDPAKFERLLNAEHEPEAARKFVSLLLSRQIDRHRVVAKDRGYIARHYWNQCL